MIQVRKNEDGSYSVVNGHMRLKVALATTGRAEALDVESKATINVHEVGGLLLALTDDAQAAVVAAAHEIVEAARRRVGDCPGLPGEATPYFSFRAECRVDVERFQVECERDGLVADWLLIPDDEFPDVEVEMRSSATLEDLRKAVRRVVDGHTMLQTLRQCPLAANTLERDMHLR